MYVQIWNRIFYRPNISEVYVEQDANDATQWRIVVKKNWGELVAQSGPKSVVLAEFEQVVGKLNRDFRPPTPVQPREPENVQVRFPVPSMTEGDPTLL